MVDSIGPNRIIPIATNKAVAKSKLEPDKRGRGQPRERDDGDGEEEQEETRVGKHIDERC